MPLHHVRESLLPRLSLHRPVTVVMVFSAFLVLGVIATTRIGVAMLPSGLDHRSLGLWVPYRNATATEVEQQIAQPVEGVLRTMSGVERIYTNSHDDGCWARVSFDQNVDMSDAYNQLRDRVDRIMAELPDDVDRVYVRKWNDDDIPVLGIDFPVTGSYDDIYSVVEQYVRQPLERIDGVANVSIWGVDPYRVEIGLVEERINAHHVNMYRLAQQLQHDNFAVSSGWIREGSTKLYVRSDSRFRSLDEIRNLPVEGSPGLKLSDVAEVRYAPPERTSISRLDGQRGFGMVIRKESMANTVDVVNRVKAALFGEILEQPQLKGFRARVFLDQGRVITDSLSQLEYAGLGGGIFAVLVLYYFLRRYRMTLVITGAIPLSILISLTAIYFLGWTLNTITMMGLILGFGMVVDNSIVVTEAIYARRATGEDVIPASLHGASEVGLAITVSTMTSVVVFLPLIFMTGDVEMSFFMARIGMPVIFALLGSLVVALLFIPLVTSRVMSSKAPREPKSIALAARIYRRALRFALHHRFEAVLVAVAVFLSFLYPYHRLANSTGMHGDIVNDMFVSFDMPDYYSLETADSLMQRYEAFMNTKRDQYGIEYLQVDASQGWGRIQAFLHSDTRPWHLVAYDRIRRWLGLRANGQLSREDALRDFIKTAPRYPGVELSIDRHRRRSQLASVSLFGEDTAVLLRLAKEVERRLRLVPGVTDVLSDMEEGNDELLLSVDRERAQRVGIDGRRVASTISTVSRGRTLTPFRSADRDVEMLMALREEDRQTLDQVKNLVIVGDDGARTTVGTLVNVSVDKGLRNIRRENGKTRVVVSAESTNRDVVSLASQISGALKGFTMPPGYQWSLTGRFEQIGEEQNDLVFAVILSTAFVVILMGILFESFILPLSVILSIPFSFVGVNWLLWATNSTFDMMARIGTIILIGVVVNNAIVLVDLINRLRAEGFTQFEAIVEAGRQRFRPILMTSATTIFGLVPMAVGDSNMIGIPYNTLGIAMIGGLATSTLLTLFVVPLFYSFLDDLRGFASRVTGLVSRKEPPETSD